MAITKSVEIALATNYPAEHLDQRERKVLQVAEQYVPALSGNWGSSVPTTQGGALDSLAASNAGGYMRTVKAQYDKSTMAGTGAVSLGVSIPAKAVVMECVVHTLVANVGATDMDLSVNAQPLAPNVHDNALNSVEQDVSTPFLTSAASNVTLTITGTATAGKFNFFIRYWQSE